MKIFVKCTPEAMAKFLEIHASFPISLHRCFLLVVYEDKFTSEAMENFSVRSTYFLCNHCEDFGQGYAGGYGQIFGDTCFVPISLHYCSLLGVYKDKFTPEAMEKFFQDISLWVFVQVY